MTGVLGVRYRLPGSPDRFIDVRIQWYPGSYGPLTEVKVLNVGGALFNTIKIWVFALAIPELMGS